jgi:dihydrofolate reductase
VDTVEVAIIPVLLGGGVQMLPGPADRAGLRLTKHTVYPRTGTVALEYAVSRGVGEE